MRPREAVVQLRLLFLWSVFLGIMPEAYILQSAVCHCGRVWQPFDAAGDEQPLGNWPI